MSDDLVDPGRRALLLFDVNNIRYVTATKIGEWERDKLCRFALLMRGKEPIVWDFGSAAVHHRLYATGSSGAGSPASTAYGRSPA